VNGMKLCGLTGGVGMGKSTAAGFFLALGTRVVDTDKLARELAEPGQPALEEIQREFGPGVLDPDGRLKRAELARVVFADPAARKKLEAILHPRIRERWRGQVAQWRAQDCPVAIVVIPLLFETGAEAEFDRIAEGRPAQHFDLRVVAKAHLEQPAAQFGIAAHADDVAAAADAELIQSASFGIRALIAGLKTTWLSHNSHSLTASGWSPLSLYDRNLIDVETQLQLEKNT